MVRSAHPTNASHITPTEPLLGGTTALDVTQAEVASSPAVAAAGLSGDEPAVGVAAVAALTAKVASPLATATVTGEMAVTYCKRINPWPCGTMRPTVTGEMAVAYCKSTDITGSMILNAAAYSASGQMGGSHIEPGMDRNNTSLRPVLAFPAPLALDTGLPDFPAAVAPPAPPVPLRGLSGLSPVPRSACGFFPVLPPKSRVALERLEWSRYPIQEYRRPRHFLYLAAGGRYNAPVLRHRPICKPHSAPLLTATA